MENSPSSYQQETLTCKATWVNELNEKETYMMGTLDFRYIR